MAATVAVVMLFATVLQELVRFSRISQQSELARILVAPKLEKPGAGIEMPVAYTQTFQQIPGVKVVNRIKVFFGKHESGASYIIAGEEDSGIELSRDFFPVDEASLAAWKKERPLGAIVGAETANELHLKVGDLAELPTQYGPMQIKVVGLSKGAMIAHRIATHFEYMQEFTKDQGTCAYRVYTAPGDLDRVAREIIDRTKNSEVPADAFSDSQFAQNWVRHVSLIPALLGFLGAFLALTTALTLANNTAISIRERRVQTATLRVLGFRKQTIVRLMLGEAVLVGLAGAAIAIAIMLTVLHSGVQLTPGADRLLQKVTLSPFGIGCGVAIAILVPLIGALPASLAAVRRPLVDALRETA